jgi:hypothetical protein
LLEGAVDTSRRACVEWVIEEADADSRFIILGVTALEAVPPTGPDISDSPESRLYSCHSSRAWPGYRAWGASGRRRKGGR